LSKLANESAEAEINDARAVLLVNIVIDACRRGDIPTATRRCAELLDLPDDLGPYRADLLRRRVTALRNLCRAESSASQHSEAATSYATLKQIVEAVPSLVRWQAIALSDIIAGTARGLPLETAWALYQELVPLVDVADIDGEARVRACEGLGTFALQLCKTGAAAQAEELLFTWRDEVGYSQVGCREIWAQVGANVVSAYVDAGDLASAQRVHADQRRLIAIDPSNTNAAGDLGRGTQVLLAGMGQAGMTVEARAVLQDHRRDLHRFDSEVRESMYFLALFYLLLGLTNPGGDLEEAARLLRAHGGVLTSEAFTKSIRERMGADVEAEWSRRVASLVPDKPPQD
jgi:hypothetical protein